MRRRRTTPSGTLSSLLHFVRDLLHSDFPGLLVRIFRSPRPSRENRRHPPNSQLSQNVPLEDIGRFPQPIRGVAAKAGASTSSRPHLELVEGNQSTAANRRRMRFRHAYSGRLLEWRVWFNGDGIPLEGAVESITHKGTRSHAPLPILLRAPRMSAKRSTGQPLPERNDASARFQA